MNVKRLRKIAIAKKILHGIWVLIIGGGAWFFIGLGIYKGGAFLKQHFGVEERIQLTEQHKLISFYNGNVKIKTREPAQKIPTRFDKCDKSRMSRDSVIYLTKNNECFVFSLKSGALSKPYLQLFGYIKPDRPWIACVDSNKKLGFLDLRTSKEVIPCQFYFDRDFSSFCYNYEVGFCGNHCILRLSPELDGIIDTTGKILIEAQEITRTSNYDGYLVKQDNREYLYSKDLRCMLSDKAEIIVLGSTILYTDSLEGETMLTDFNFTQSTPVYLIYFEDLQYDGLSAERKALCGDSSQAPQDDSTFFIFSMDGAFGVGIMDQNLNVLVDPRWGWLSAVHIGNGYFACCYGAYGVLMDKNRHFVSPKRLKKLLQTK